MNPPRQSVLILIIADLSPRSSRYTYVSNLPADATLKMLAATIKARWICEQAHQQLKEELGLDHFEGRSWVGLHRHALMTMIARSEEHTSELQSLMRISYAVFCLKKTNNTEHQDKMTTIHLCNKNGQ